MKNKEVCANPLHECGSTDIHLYLTVDGKQLPICKACWRDELCEKVLKGETRLLDVKCPKCGGKLRKTGWGLSTSSNPSIFPFAPPYWRCDHCQIGSYDLKSWYSKKGKILEVKKQC